MYKRGFLLLTLLLMITSCQFKEGLFFYLGIGNTITFGGSQVDEVDFITTDEEGNIYLAGRFYGEIDLNPREGEDWRTTDGAASSDIYLIKLNHDYTYGWSRIIKGWGMEEIGGLAAASGAVYLMGSFDTTTDFNSDGGGDKRGVNMVGSKDIFLTSFSSSGEYLYTVTRSSLSPDHLFGEKLLTDRAGNLYLFYRVEPSNNIGLLKTDSQGNEIWNMIPPAGTQKIITDAVWGDNGKLYAVGAINNGGIDYYIAEIDPNGGISHEWFFGGGFDEGFTSVTADSEGLYIAGKFWNNSIIDGISLGSGSGENIVLLKVSYDYEVKWARSFENRSATTLEPESLVKASNKLYLSGSFDGEVDFDPMGERLVSTDWGMKDIFLSTFTTGGSYLDTKFIKSSDDNYNSVLHSSRGWLLWGGSFSGEVNFKTKSDGGDDFRISKGFSDVFMTIIVE